MKKVMKAGASITSIIFAGLLVMVLILAASIPTKAGTGGTELNPEAAKFAKTLQYASGAGLTTPNVTFTFTFEKLNLDGVSSQAMQESMPSISDKTISFLNSDQTNNSSGMETVSKSSDNVLNNLEWTGTGVYKYKAVETASVTPPLGTGESITYSQAEYILTVVVARSADSGKLYVEQTIIEKVKDDTGKTNETGTETGKGDPSDPDGASFNFIFTNTYIKNGGVTPGKDALTIYKTTTGTGSDPLRQFTFTIKANDSVTGKTAGSYIGKVYNSSNLAVPERDITLIADDSKSATFDLASGEKIVFDDLPAGTTFTVEETGTPGYSPSYLGVTAAGNINGSATRGENLSTGLQTIKADENNNVAFTNTYDDSLIPGGILTNNLPFIILFGVIIIVFIAYAYSNSRKVKR